MKLFEKKSLEQPTSQTNDEISSEILDLERELTLEHPIAAIGDLTDREQFKMRSKFQ